MRAATRGSEAARRHRGARIGPSQLVDPSSKAMASPDSIDSEDTLRFSAMAGVRPMTEIFPFEKAAEAYERMMSNKARFRVVIITGH